ncbi:MAG: hypothetical protein WC050_03370, partial [Candidatus Paceibacterota bacterium]
MNISPDFFLYVLVQWAFLVLEGMRAYRDRYWTMAQARATEPDQSKKVGAVCWHPGYWFQYVAALIAAYILDNYAHQWSARLVVLVGFVVATAVVFVPMSMWAKATTTALSEGFARFGLTSIPGVMLGKFITFFASVVILYLLTPNSNHAEVWVTTGLVMAIMTIGVILPSWQTFKEIRGDYVSMALLLDAGL